MKIELLNLERFSADSNLAEFKIVGSVDIILENSLVVENLKIIKNEDNNLFVAMPSKKTATGRIVEVAYPITDVFADEISKVVIAGYNGEKINDQISEELVITDMKIRIIEDLDNIKAKIAILFNDKFVVNDIFILEKNNKLKVVMPSKRDKQNKTTTRNIVYPKNEEFGQYILKKICNKYKVAKNK